MTRLAAALAALAVALAPQAHAITEDDPAWSCITNGNHICGPANDQGATPGCYSTAGQLIAPWPCRQN